MPDRQSLLPRMSSTTRQYAFEAAMRDSVERSMPPAVNIARSPCIRRDFRHSFRFGRIVRAVEHHPGLIEARQRPASANFKSRFLAIEKFSGQRLRAASPFAKTSFLRKIATPDSQQRFLSRDAP